MLKMFYINKTNWSENEAFILVYSDSILNILAMKFIMLIINNNRKIMMTNQQYVSAIHDYYERKRNKSNIQIIALWS